MHPQFNYFIIFALWVQFLNQIYLMNKEILINQSLIKDLLKYEKDDLCGLVFTNKWIYKNFGKSSLSQNLGHYFEYLATGSLPKGGKVPLPESLKPYGLVKEQVEYFNYLFEKKGIEITNNGFEIEADNKWVGTLDVLANWKQIFEDESVYLDSNNTDYKVIIDLKYSGLLEDKYSDFGWDENSLPHNDNTLLQATHYKFLYWKKYGVNIPFFFFVFDSKKTKKAKLIHISIPEYKLEKHEEFLNKAKFYFDNQIKLGFKPKPEYKRCIECDYLDICLFKVDLPEIIHINL